MRLVSTILNRECRTFPSSQKGLLDRAALENPGLRARKPGHSDFDTDVLWQVTDPSELEFVHLKMENNNLGLSISQRIPLKFFLSFFLISRRNICSVVFPTS